jgi:hypothetical protein
MFFFSLKLIVKTKHPLSLRGERNNYALYNIPFSNYNTTKKFLRAFLRVFVGFVNCTRQLRPSKVLGKVYTNLQGRLIILTI